MSAFCNVSKLEQQVIEWGLTFALLVDRFRFGGTFGRLGFIFSVMYS